MVARDNKDLSELVRTSLKNYYKTNACQWVHKETLIPIERLRGFFYKKTHLNAFDLMMILYTYDFIRDSVGLARFEGGFSRCGNKLREKNTENVFLILKNNPTWTFCDIAAVLKTTSRCIEYEINKLKKMRLLERTGGRKNGKWVVR